MKTPIDFIEHELWKQSKNGKQTLPVGTITQLMKEYAKQWVNHASDIAAFDCQDMLISQRIKELTKIIEKQ